MFSDTTETTRSGVGSVELGWTRLDNLANPARGGMVSTAMNFNHGPGYLFDLNLSKNVAFIPIVKIARGGQEHASSSLVCNTLDCL